MRACVRACVRVYLSLMFLFLSLFCFFLLLFVCLFVDDDDDETQTGQEFYSYSCCCSFNSSLASGNLTILTVSVCHTTRLQRPHEGASKANNEGQKRHPLSAVNES